MSTALDIFSMAFDTVEIRTALTPPVFVKLRGPPDPRTEALMREVQPALIFTGAAGRQEIAPYGIPSGISPRVKQWAIAGGIGLGASVLGLMLFGGALRKR